MRPCCSICLNLYPRGKGTWAVMKPWKTLPMAVNINIWSTLYTFCFSIEFIMSGFCIMFIGLALATVRLKYPLVSWQ